MYTSVVSVHSQMQNIGYGDSQLGNMRLLVQLHGFNLHTTWSTAVLILVCVVSLWLLPKQHALHISGGLVTTCKLGIMFWLMDRNVSNTMEPICLGKLLGNTLTSIQTHPYLI